MFTPEIKIYISGIFWHIQQFLNGQSMEEHSKIVRNLHLQKDAILLEPGEARYICQ